VLRRCTLQVPPAPERGPPPPHDFLNEREPHYDHLAIALVTPPSRRRVHRRLHLERRCSPLCRRDALSLNPNRGSDERDPARHVADVQPMTARCPTRTGASAVPSPRVPAPPVRSPKSGVTVDGWFPVPPDDARNVRPVRVRPRGVTIIGTADGRRVRGSARLPPPPSAHRSPPSIPHFPACRTALYDGKGCLQHPYGSDQGAGATAVHPGAAQPILASSTSRLGRWLPKAEVRCRSRAPADGSERELGYVRG